MTSDPAPGSDGLPPPGNTQPLGNGQQPDNTQPLGNIQPSGNTQPPGYGPLPGHIQPPANIRPPANVQPPRYGPPSYGPPPYGPPAPHSTQGYVQPGMRASSADRERTIDVLKASYGEGRLTKDEFDVRCTRAMAARTYAELASVVADLPAGPLGAMLPYQAGGYFPVVQTPASGLAVGSLVCGIAEFFTMGLAGIPAVILGHAARAHIKRTGERGDGMAIAGLILGYLAIAGWALFIITLAATSR